MYGSALPRAVVCISRRSTASRNDARGRDVDRLVASVDQPAGPVVIALPARSLVLVAGLPGAGKSALLAGLPARPGVLVIDSQDQRDAIPRWLTEAVGYRVYRPLVHLRHRLAIVVAAAAGPPTVVVHLPATAARTRAAVALLAALTRRGAFLLWLDVDPAVALRGQRRRGRTVPGRAFAAHARRAAATTARLRAGHVPAGWRAVTVLDRAATRAGVALDVGSAVASK
jgi:hypothetical protein